MSEKASENLDDQAPEPLDFRNKSNFIISEETEINSASIVPIKKVGRSVIINTSETEIPSPLEKMEAQFHREEKERQVLRERFGDPSEALAKLLAHISPSILEKNFPED